MADPRVIHTYRHLYRACLHAVQFSKPARFVARDKLRTAFREKDAELDERGSIRTLRFLEAAARERGLEHNVLKNLLVITYFRDYHDRRAYPHIMNEKTKATRRGLQHHIEDTAYKHYEISIAMLNKSLGICLR